MNALITDTPVTGAQVPRTERDVLRLSRQFTGRHPARAFLLSPLLVAATTWLLYSLQTSLGNVERHSIRPFDIGYLIPVLFLTVLGGRAVGVLTLALSASASACVLSTPHFSFAVAAARDRTELLMLVVVGGLVVVVAGVFHGALREMADALMAAQMENQVCLVATGVAGVGRLHSCTVEKAGLDYHVALSVGACPASALGDAGRLATDVERALRRANPLITDARIHIVP